MLDDAASRQQGQLFTLVNGDMVLLFPPADSGIALAATLGNLFASDAPDPGLLLSRWPLPDHEREFTAFLDALPTIASAPGQVEQDSGLAAVTTVFKGLEPRRIRDLLQRQTGVLLTVGGTQRLLPVYREVKFSLSALEARVAASGHVTADPFLFRHLTAKLDTMMLLATTVDLEHERPMVAGARGGPNGAARQHVTRGGAVAQFHPACGPRLADPTLGWSSRSRCWKRLRTPMRFIRARSLVAEAGFGLALDDVSHHALLLTKPSALSFDWLKLEWSRQILQSGDTLAEALKEIDPARVILQKADTEDAVRWGIFNGIRRFQGRHIDAILAARRLALCHSAELCTLRKCIERESGTTPASRIGCNNLQLLDLSSAEAEQLA